MNAKNKTDKLSEMTRQISGSLEVSAAPNAGGYEYSTAYLTPITKQIIGRWKVIEHLADGRSWPEAFCASTLRDIPVSHIDYDAVYDFSRNLCVKKVKIHAELELSGNTSIYEYRMNVALSWELKPGIILAQPVLGYQYSSIDSKPAAVKDLPPTAELISLSVRFEDEFMILEDGTDRKKLERVNP